jgi:hypothetical protein
MMNTRRVITKAVILSAVVVVFVFGCQGSLNPLTWKSQLERFVSPQQLIQPDAAADFYADMREGIQHDPEEISLHIKWRIPYTNDLFVHGALNHFATAEEVLQTGRDDCDGQAVLLCSVLRHAGYDAVTVIGPSHAWVEVVSEDDVLFIDYRGGDWFVRFNESSQEWEYTLFFIMVAERFFLLAVFFSIILYGYQKGVLTYVGEFFGFLKYVILLFLTSAAIIVIFARFWTAGMLIACVSALVVFELIARVRKALENRTSQGEKTTRKQ